MTPISATAPEAAALHAGGVCHPSDERVIRDLDFDVRPEAGASSMSASSVIAAVNSISPIQLRLLHPRTGGTP